MSALTIRIRVVQEPDGTFSAEEADGPARSERRPTRESAVAAVQVIVLRRVAGELADGVAGEPVRSVAFDVRARRNLPARPESRPGLLRVLLVEDDEAIRNLMRRSLEAAGFRALEAGNAEEATALLEQSPVRVDLVITDVMLPGESGIELVHRLEAQHPGVRTLLVSGFAPSSPGSSTPFEPGTAFLSKPFTGEQLVGKVHELLQGAPPAASDASRDEVSAPSPAPASPRAGTRRRYPRADPHAPRADVARVLLAATNPAEARFIGNYLESAVEHRVRVETASTPGSVRTLARRRPPELVLIDHGLIAQDQALIGDLSRELPVVVMQPASEPPGADGANGVVRREPAMLANLARAMSRLIDLPEPSDEARAARRHEFVDVVCHDLRNPASTIAGYAELMLDRGRQELSGEQASSLLRIRRNAYFMLDLIESILDTERLEAGVLRAAPSSVDLADMVRDAVEDFRPAAEAKCIGLVAEVPAAPLLVAVDPKLFARAIGNLVSNAIKFSPASTRVEVGLASAAASVQLWVRDSGPGIPPAEQERLFTKFGRTSVLATRGEHQTGLGLFIVKRIVELHGARIVVDSTPGRGSEFRIHMRTV